MRAVLRYALAASGLVAVVVAAAWMALDPRGRFGVLMAAAVALPVQVAAFALLVRGRERGTEAFLGAWVAGTLVRMGIVLGAGLLLLRVTALAPAPTLLSLAGFFFGLLLLEPLFWGSGSERTTGNGT